jgi:polygalacturonase
MRMMSVHLPTRRRPARPIALALALAAVSCAGTPRSPAGPPVAATAPAPAPAPAPIGSASAPDAAIDPINAPFAMADLQRPRFPAATFDVRQFGAIADGTTKNTAAFAKAIAAAAQAGGGRVVVPPGRWLTGPIHLQSHVDLEVQTGAVLLFSQTFADYLPPVLTRWEGLEVYNYSPLIYARDCTDVAVTGGGKLDGQGSAWWPWKKKQEAGAKRLYEMAVSGTPTKDRVFGTEADALRPSFIQTVNCKNVLIEGVTVSNGPMWTIHPVYSENVIIKGVQVITEGPNNDGCNPDSSKNVLIEDSFFSTGDDCIIIKSGLNEDGWRVGKPSENIVVRRVRGALGHGGVGIGSEMSGGVRNVWVHDCEFKGTDRGLRIKSMRGRGGVVENVWYERVRHEDLRLMVVELTTFYGSSTLKPRTQTPPTIRGVHVRDISGVGAKKAIDIIGLPERPIEDVTFDNVDVVSQNGVHCVDARNVRFNGVKIAAENPPAFSIEKTERVALVRSCPALGNDCLRLEGSNEKLTIDEIAGQGPGPAPPIARSGH